MSRGRRQTIAGLAMVLAVALGVGLALTAGRGGAQADPLDPELRKAVERLKADATRPAAGIEEARERLQVLWRWANAFALAGGALPVDFPQHYVIHILGVRTVSGRPEDAAIAALKEQNEAFLAEIDNVGAPDFDDPAAVVRAASDFVARYARELALKDEHPDALGTLRLAVPGEARAPEGAPRAPERAPDRGPRSAGAAAGAPALVADALSTVVQTWTVGELPMRPGGGIVLTGAITSGRGIFLQTADPAAEGYVTVRASRPGAKLVAAEPWAEWRTFITRSVVAFRLEGAALERGDTVTITYGDTSAGSPGLRMHRYSNDRAVFPVHLDLEGEGVVWTPSWPSLEVRGAAGIERVVAVASPSVVAAGETVTLAVRSEDRWKNVSSSPAPGYRVLLDGEEIATVPAGGDALHVIEDLRVAGAGVHRFEVVSADRRLAATSNPVWVGDAPPARILWGDTHGHSGFAEGQGSPDGYYEFGRNVARLDFLSLSEHDMWMDDGEWRSLVAAVEKHRDPGSFTPLLGYEWTSIPPLGGHHNVYFSDTAPTRRRVPLQEALELAEMWSGVRAANETEDVLVIPHAHQAGDWTRSDGELERLVEISSGHGTFEDFGRAYLENDFEVGFIGSSDNHNGHPGYTGIGNQQTGGLAAVIAPQNTTEEVFRALRARSTYATTGERILLDARLNGEPMGRRIADADLRTLTARVSGTQPIDFVDVVKNGRVVYRRREQRPELESRVWVQVWLESSTEVFEEHRNPRGARPWQGAIEVEGARLVSWSEPSFAHPESFAVTRPEGAANRLDFRLLTRGRGTAILLELDGASAASRVKVRLDAARELSADPGWRVRPPAELPAQELAFALGELASGAVARELEVLRHTDRVQLQLLGSRDTLDVDLEYRDNTRAAPGDWYYLRVAQIDGAMAWSSPWWVGERE